jgi:hypothetical protein
VLWGFFLGPFLILGGWDFALECGPYPPPPPIWEVGRSLFTWEGDFLAYFVARKFETT